MKQGSRLEEDKDFARRKRPLGVVWCSCFVQGAAVVDQICANDNLQAVQGKPGCLADQATRQPSLPATYLCLPLTLACHSPTGCHHELPLGLRFLAPFCCCYQLPGSSNPKQSTTQIRIFCWALHRCSSIRWQSKKCAPMHCIAMKQHKSQEPPEETWSHWQQERVVSFCHLATTASLPTHQSQSAFGHLLQLLEQPWDSPALNSALPPWILLERSAGVSQKHACLCGKRHWLDIFQVIFWGFMTCPWEMTSMTQGNAIATLQAQISPTTLRSRFSSEATSTLW